ncbi:MAG: IspD/TarI family cytidylyltransferase [Phycisphaerae bacterium]
MAGLSEFTVILPAAGQSTRFGAGDKLLVDLAGRTVLQRAVALFTQRADVVAVIIAAAEGRIDLYRQHLQSVLAGKTLYVLSGGSERWESVYKALSSGEVRTPYVAVHDAARPVTPSEVIDAAFAGAVSHGAALPVLAEPATLKRLAPDQTITQTVARAGLFQAQTPQCFRTALLRQGFEMLMHTNRINLVTDDAQIIELTGGQVLGTRGDALNIKVTTVGDARLCAALQAGIEATTLPDNGSGKP